MNKAKLLMTATLAICAGAGISMDIPEGVVRNTPRPPDPEGLDLIGKPKRLGLREQIAQAKTVGEVTILLEKSSSYYEASVKTRRSWARTAARRIKALGGAL